MNVIEVGKKENIGKEYRVFLDEKDLGVWIITENKANGEFDFYQNYKVLSDRYISQVMRMEFKEVIDWAKVPVDTKVLVSENGKDWYRRYFVKYVDDMVYCFDSGATSFSIQDDDYISSWKYAKLYQE